MKEQTSKTLHIMKQNDRYFMAPVRSKNPASEISLELATYLAGSKAIKVLKDLQRVRLRILYIKRTMK